MIHKRVRSCAFSLVELAVVVVIIGILAAFAVPRFLSAVERSKAAESFNFLSTVAAAQERYHAVNGAYAARLEDLDVSFSHLQYFETGGVDPSDADTLQTQWSITLTRKGASAGYGAYTVVFTQDGFDEDNSTIAQFPDINPIQTDDK